MSKYLLNLSVFQLIAELLLLILLYSICKKNQQNIKKIYFHVVIDIGKIKDFVGFSYFKIDQLRAISKLRLQKCWKLGM